MVFLSRRKRQTSAQTRLLMGEGCRHFTTPKRLPMSCQLWYSRSKFYCICDCSGFSYPANGNTILLICGETRGERGACPGGFRQTEIL